MVLRLYKKFENLTSYSKFSIKKKNIFYKSKHNKGNVSKISKHILLFLFTYDTILTIFIYSLIYSYFYNIFDLFLKKNSLNENVYQLKYYETYIIELNIYNLIGDVTGCATFYIDL